MTIGKGSSIHNTNATLAGPLVDQSVEESLQRMVN